jgi:hypothetical protein
MYSFPHPERTGVCLRSWRVRTKSLFDFRAARSFWDQADENKEQTKAHPLFVKHLPIVIKARSDDTMACKVDANAH